MLTWSSRRHLPLGLSLLLLSSHAEAQSPVWTNPPSSAPAFTSTFANGDFITLSWLGLNHSLSDLWLTSADANNPYSFRIAANINITAPGTLPWSITVNETEIAIDNRFELKFVPTRTDINRAETFDQIVSPGFVLLQSDAFVVTSTASIAPQSVVQSSTNASVAATAEATISSQFTPGVTDGSAVEPAATSSPPSPSSEPASSSGLSTGAKAGIGVAVGGVFLIILVLMFWVLRLRQRVKAVSNQHSWGILPDSPTDTTATLSSMTLTEKHIPGLHEVHGDRRQPSELGTKDKEPRRSIYEMAG